MNTPRKPLVVEIEPKKPKTKSKTPKAKPVLVAQNPADAAPVPEPTGQAMQAVTAFAARKPSRLWRFFWGAALAVFAFIISVLFWDFVSSLLTRNLWLGRVALGLLAVLGIACICLIWRELRAFSRLRRIDGLRASANQLQTSPDLAQTQAFGKQLSRLYKSRRDMGWAMAELQDKSGDVLDGVAYLELTERSFMTPLDRAAEKEIETAARQVATGTAIVPLALADIVIALTANIRMIRRIAEIYGGRAGSFGSWRLLRAVAAHLVATGAVAIGDDMIGSIAGGGVLSKLSRRFGEGLINGALTARVGVAAMEVCRPMPFRVSKRPSVTALIQGSLKGFFAKSS